MLAMTEQVPAKVVFLKDGLRRTGKIGLIIIQLRRIRKTASKQLITLLAFRSPRKFDMDRAIFAYYVHVANAA